MARGRKLLPVGRIAAMRYYYAKDHRISELARHYGVHESVASGICHGRTQQRVLPVENLKPLPVRQDTGGGGAGRGEERQGRPEDALTAPVSSE